MHSRFVPFILLCGILGQPVSALGQWGWINPKKTGGPARDASPGEVPGLPLAPGAPPTGLQPIDPKRTGGPARGRNALGSGEATGTSQKPTMKRVGHTEVTRRLTGTITSVTKSALVVSHAVKGKKTATTVVLDPATVTRGTLKRGAKVTVTYRVENNRKIATVAEVRGTKAATRSSSTTGVKTSKPGP
jgi:hypothetical protein